MPLRDADANWTVVSSRRRRRRRQGCGRGDDDHEDVKCPPSQAEAPDATVAPLPWAPADGDEDPARVSRILHKVDAALARLEASKFYRRFLSQLRDEPTVRDSLLRVCPPPEKIQIVLYGVGSIESCEPPRLQLSLALLLRREMRDSADDVEVFDPILSAAECTAVEALGCRVPRFDDRGRRLVNRPTLFYMPHCEAALYDNLLATNWGQPSLRQMVVLGNSFREYGRFAEEGLGGRRSDGAGEKARYLWEAGDFAEEFSVANLGFDESNDSFFRAFNETSWHFFNPDRIETTKI